MTNCPLTDSKPPFLLNYCNCSWLCFHFLILYIYFFYRFVNKLHSHKQRHPIFKILSSIFGDTCLLVMICFLCFWALVFCINIQSLRYFWWCWKFEIPLKFQMSAFRFQDRYVDSLNSFQLFVEEKITFAAKSPCTHNRTIRMFQKVLKVYNNISL